jgi:hypothetical protein
MNAAGRLGRYVLVASRLVGLVAAGYGIWALWLAVSGPDRLASLLGALVGFGLAVVAVAVGGALAQRLGHRGGFESMSLDWHRAWWR